jgi:hypothetical protein
MPIVILQSKLDNKNKLRVGRSLRMRNFEVRPRPANSAPWPGRDVECRSTVAMLNVAARRSVGAAAPSVGVAV